MYNKKIPLFVTLFILVHSYVFCAPLHSQSWGFTIDVPVCYEYTGGNARDTFSFESPDGANLDIVVYHPESARNTTYPGVDALAQDVHQRLNNSGDLDFFNFNNRRTAILELDFIGPSGQAMSGWALGMELAERPDRQGTPVKPLLLALAYGPKEEEWFEFLHISALDSIRPIAWERLTPGPITEFGFPRETPILVPVFGLDTIAIIYQEDAEAAQALIDREFQVLRRYENADIWKEAWERFYRAIYRDSFDRLADLAFQVERKHNVPPRENRDFAEQVLSWVQSFEYQRDLIGSDFLNLISAAVEGRGDCDNQAMLWAIVLRKAGIPSAIMVSRYYGHAMGLADLSGPGARFELGGQRMLVAETTAPVSIGLIAEDVSATEHWLGIIFE